MCFLGEVRGCLSKAHINAVISDAKGNVQACSHQCCRRWKRQCASNAAKLFEKIVLGIYQDPKILKDFFRSVFIPGRDSLQEDLKIEFDILVDDLYVDSRLKGLSILNYENLYELE